MLIVCFACLLLAGGAFWLTGVHPARNVLRLRRTLVSFFLLLGLLSLALQLALNTPVDPPALSSAAGVGTRHR